MEISGGFTAAGGSVSAGQWNEADRQDLPGNDAACFVFFNEGQLLNLELAANRDQHDAPRFDLLH